MSQIFDALQRSEAERSGIDVSALSVATELLKRVERRTAPKSKTAVLGEDADARGSAECDTAFGRPEAHTVAVATEILVGARASSTDERSDIFGRIQSLPVSVSAQHRLVCLTESESPAAEAFRLLGVRLQHLRRDRPLKKVLITSTIPQEGKTTIAANLAYTLALRSGQRVLLLEGDLRRPALSELFGLGKKPGICEHLQGGCSLVTSIYYLEDLGLWIVPAGSAPSNPLEILQLGRLSPVVDQLAAWFDWIIIDSPPVLPLADTSVLMRLADGILLVARQGTTEKRQLQRGIEALDADKLIGALLNGCKNAAHSDYYYSPAVISRFDDTSVR
jgi:capsular exopolysaccharide synthesis family protein